MRPETVRLITQAIVESQPSVESPRRGLLDLAIAAALAARGGPTTVETRKNVLRAIAYLVRRLELDG